MNEDAFFELHRDLPREGPGSDEATREALGRLKAHWTDARGSTPPRVLDVGCGPGRQTLVLARELGVPLVAIDFHEPFLEQLRRSARAAGLEHLITARRAGMQALDYAPGTLDLIWAEGSIFIIGFATGLSLWRALLRDGGFVVASELTWLTNHPPAEARDFWLEGYPPMTTLEGNIRNAAAVGFEVFDHFVLPQQAWWDDYLTPLSRRADQLRGQTSDPELLQVLRETDQEINICRRFGEHFSYVFYLMRKVAVPSHSGCAHA